MRKVRYFGQQHTLSFGKIYDVIDIDYNDHKGIRIKIKNDYGKIVIVFFTYFDEVLFQDVTTEFRTNIIDNILS